jgi:protein required for attachment to host cells
MEKFDWVVVANGSQAKILERSKAEGSDWKEMACLIHPGTKAHDSESQGRLLGHTISGRRGLAPRRVDKKHHRQMFCKQLSEILEEGSLSNRVSGIVIFASPSILGDLLNQLGNGSKKLILATRHKDLTALPVPELINRIHQEFEILS